MNRKNFFNGLLATTSSGLLVPQTPKIWALSMGNIVKKSDLKCRITINLKRSKIDYFLSKETIENFPSIENELNDLKFYLNIIDRETSNFQALALSSIQKGIYRNFQDLTIW